MSYRLALLAFSLPRSSEQHLETLTTDSPPEKLTEWPDSNFGTLDERPGPETSVPPRARSQAMWRISGGVRRVKRLGQPGGDESRVVAGRPAPGKLTRHPPGSRLPIFRLHPLGGMLGYLASIVRSQVPVMIEDFVTVEWTSGGTVRLLDQTRLPTEEIYVECRTLEEVADAIRTMKVRGAPAIGVAAAMGLALGARTIQGATFEAFFGDFQKMGLLLTATRPTAVNLTWALRRLLDLARKSRDLPLQEIQAALIAEARRMREEDIQNNRALARHGHSLVPNPARVLTHCNAGGLATAGYGTAVGVVRAAAEAGKRIMVWVDETRPLLQGARLTAWELQRAGIPVTLIADSMAGSLMGRGQVDLVVVGADRIARNGDVANKIGTYSLALLARAHGIPFYVAAPISTLDLSLPDGSQIPIEERAPEELTHIAGRRVAPEGVRVANPAFDVTPASCVDAIITERGIARAPYGVSLPRLAGEP